VCAHAYALRPERDRRKQGKLQQLEDFLMGNRLSHLREEGGREVEGRVQTRQGKAGSRESEKTGKTKRCATSCSPSATSLQQSPVSLQRSLFE